jgi:hypothetical protein
LTRLREQKLPALKIDAPRLGPHDLDPFLDEALRRYQRARPRHAAFTVAGDGSAYDFALPDGTLYSSAPAWVVGYSAVLSVEFPAGEREPVYLEQDAYALWPRDVPTALRLLFETPATGQSARVTYSVPHTLSEAVSTIPSTDADVVLNLWARAVCVSLAASVVEAKDNVIAGDSVNYRDMAQKYQSLAKSFGELLPAEFRDTDKQTPGGAAGAWVDWDPRAQGDYPYVWRRSRTR